MFSTNLTGLLDGITYYFVAYATNSAGTAYGTTLSFDTPSGNSVTDYDGNVYPIVVIGEQTWMAKSLKTTHYSNGTSIPLVEGNSEWAALGSTNKAYSYYENNASYGNTYGALYTWAAAMNGAPSSSSNPSGVQGVCPDGWHLPSDEEWKEMEMYLGMSQSEADNSSYRGTDQGNKLKESGYTHWASPNAGNNSSGFTALGGGFRLDGGGTFGYLANAVAYWTATQNSSTEAWDRTLQNDNSQVYRSDFPKNRGFYVRCIKD
jgi:uncharacterized protein (TIGR02145 family)